MDDGLNIIDGLSTGQSRQDRPGLWVIFVSIVPEANADGIFFVWPGRSGDIMPSMAKQLSSAIRG